MAVTAIDVLKSWFETGDKPTQDQFASLIDSFRHKNTDIAVTDLGDDVINLINSSGSSMFIVAVNAQQITLPAGLYDKIVVIDTPGTEFTIGTTEGDDDVVTTCTTNAKGYYSLQDEENLKFDVETTLFVNGVSATAIIKVRKS